MADLSSGQNRRLREAMKRARDELFGGSVTALATALERKQPSISDFINNRGGASFETARRFAVLVHQNVTELIGPADDDPDVPPPPVLEIVRDDRYPSRAKAAQAARLLGLDERAIADVLGVALDADEDPGERYWFKLIERRHEELNDPFAKRGRLGVRDAEKGDF